MKLPSRVHPRNHPHIAAQLFVADTFDALIADILAPEFHNSHDLAQPVD